MKRLRCERCEITVSPSWAWIWYRKSFTSRSGPGKTPRTRELWLCPDCAGEFRSARARDAFLKAVLDEGE
jgi:hypothetical protein